MAASPLRMTSPRADLPDERELIARAQRGDLDAFEPLYRAHVGRVFAICLRMTGESVRARELVQDVFVRAWEKLATFRGEAAFSSWLHRLAVNVVLMAARAERRRLPHAFDRMREGGDAEGAAGDDGPDPADAVAARRDAVEERMDLEKAVAALPRGARTDFVLHDMEGYQHDEIARMMGIAEGTVRAHLFRARRLLMKSLDR
jgi:RNA polymerase sigma-70 factor (ECF subfamily)